MNRKGTVLPEDTRKLGKHGTESVNLMGKVKILMKSLRSGIN